MRRVARHGISKARRLLGSGSLSDTTVHDARKEIRKSRAAIRLLRVALGNARFQRENARLRDAGRALNEARDAKVLVSTLELLRRGHPHLERDSAFAALSDRLHLQRRTSRRHLYSVSAPAVAAARRTLEQSQFSAKTWPVSSGGWGKLGPAFKRVYAAGRLAARKSQTDLDDHSLHEWRKQVKYLRHALQVFAPLRPAKLKKHARLARRLADSLGDGHDLALLRASAVSVAGQGAPTLKPLLSAIDQQRRALREQSFELGQRVYADSPSAMDKRLGRYWHRWHGQTR